MAALDDELAFALELASRSGALATEYLQGGEQSLDPQHKPGDEGLVTRADTAVNELICQALGERFPGDGILAEESARSDAWRGPDRCWHIDPIDGTREFAANADSWAVHIGLSIEGKAVLGVVFEPAVGRVSWGVTRGDRRAAFRLGDGETRPLRPSSRGFGDLLLTSSRSHATPKTEEVMGALGIGPDQNFRTGSVGVKLGRIARGDSDVYAHPSGRTKLWDTCAPEAIIAAAGGVITDLHGEPLQYRGPEIANARGLLASHGPHHGAIVERLAPLVAGWGDL